MNMYATLTKKYGSDDISIVVEIIKSQNNDDKKTLKLKQLKIMMILLFQT